MSRHDIRRTLEKVRQRLELITPLVFRRQHPITPFRFHPLSSPLDAPPLDADTSTWAVIEPHTYWGERYLNFALAGEFTIPADWDADAPVVLYLPLGESGDFSHPEALVYVDGVPYAACDRHHQTITLRDAWRDGRSHRLLLHGWTGLLGGTWAKDAAKLYMRPCSIAQIDTGLRNFVALARVAVGAAADLPPDGEVRERLLDALDEAFKKLDTREPFGDALYDSTTEAHAILWAGIDAAGEPMRSTIIATGHAHIDVAWLWTLGQTRRKAGRTFSTVLRYMEEFPDYHFTQSQPQLYDYLRHDYPSLFEDIKARVAEGRWEPIGGMWVEADCNVSGGESLVRQLVLGRRFFREHFGEGAESPVLWLPDVFGYAWNLPQLIKGAGLEYFFTIKIGWNQVNKMPYDSFWWQGLDGTKVLTHFSTTPEQNDIRSNATYNANLNPRAVLGSWINLKHKADQRTMLMSFGYGDGGGGPSREMLENAASLANFPGLPRVQQGSVIDFFRQLEQEAGHNLPTWNGELYLEVHRGTYTTQSRNKRANRKSEFLLHDAEFVATMASMVDAGYVYPHEPLRKAWELVCLNQFHDIIPGSSIGAVYEESLTQYEQVRQMGESVRDEALKVIAAHVGGDIVIVNPTSFDRDSDLAFWPGHLPPGQRLRSLHTNIPVEIQPTAEGTWISTTIFRYSTAVLKIEEGEPEVKPLTLEATTTSLENAALRVEFNPAGDITRIYDKFRKFEVLPAGAVANQWQAFEDRPLNWDAWDIDNFYDDKMWTAEPAASIEVIENGPLRATVEIKRRILNSTYTQRISLESSKAIIEFDTDIDWRERHVLLKAAFPVDLLSPVATYEIQWGSVQRPTHRNTSWDWARFEVCAQKWVTLSEDDYPITLINDCKYGHDIHDNVMRISLLRSPTQPDPEADQGEHRFRYALKIGRAGGSAAQAAYCLNDPLIVINGTGDSKQRSRLAFEFLSDNGNAIIETIKRADDNNGLIIRLYQSIRAREVINLTTPFPLRAAYITNLLEENQEELTVRALSSENRSAVELLVKPFQVVTLRLVPA